MKTIDAVKFEGLLITEYNSLAKSFNWSYANTRQEGINAVKAEILQAKIDIYAQIIEAFQASMESK